MLVYIKEMHVKGMFDKIIKKLKLGSCKIKAVDDVDAFKESEETRG